MAREHALDRALLALALFGSGILSLALGQDVNFDQLQYHVYLGWSLVAGRFEKDIAAAGLAAYFNPLLHVTSYLGLSYLPPRLFGFLLGALQGLNPYLAYRLAFRVLGKAPQAQLLAALAGVVAAAGPCAVSLLGTTFGDNTLSPLVLGSLLLLASAADAPQPLARRVFLAGLLGGLAGGLKLTFLAFALALAAAAIVLAILTRRAQAFLVFAGGGIAGAVLGAGFWGLKLWHRFGNPIFPFANNVFRSPYLEAKAASDPNWAARGLGDFVMPPLDLALGRSLATEGRLLEIAARDIRFLVLALLLAAALARLALRRPARETPRPASLVVVTAWIAGYWAWVWAFHYYRYFAAGEFMAPAAIVALLRFCGVRRLGTVWAALAAAILLTTATQSWGRMAWSDRPLRVDVPWPPSREGAIVLVGGAQCSYTLPSFPAEARFFGIFGTTPKLESEAVRQVERHPGPFYLLAPQAVGTVDLRRYGLAEQGSCVVLKTGGRGRYRLCPLARLSGARPDRARSVE